MAFNYASNQALQAMVTKVESLLANKVNVEAGKGLSTNDLTNALKAQYDAAYTHSQAAHAPADAEKNVIVAVTFNGEPVTVNPSTRTAQITADFATDSDVSSAISSALANYYNKSETDTKIASAIAAANHLKYEIVAQLPTDDIDVNTIYMVQRDDASGQDIYTEYMYVNSKWEIVGDTTVDLTNYYTKGDVDSKISTALAEYVKKTDMVEITAETVNGMFTA